MSLLFPRDMDAMCMPLHQHRKQWSLVSDTIVRKIAGDIKSYSYTLVYVVAMARAGQEISSRAVNTMLFQWSFDY